MRTFAKLLLICPRFFQSGFNPATLDQNLQFRLKVFRFENFPKYRLKKTIVNKVYIYARGKIVLCARPLCVMYDIILAT